MVLDMIRAHQKVVRTSLEVNSAPSLHLAPWRSLTWKVSPSSRKLHSVAISGSHSPVAQ
jgi:hypothetical protein